MKKILDINLIKNEIVPLFKALANDDQDSVRLLTVGACVEIAKILSNEDIQEHVRFHLFMITGKQWFQLAPVLKTLTEDKSWRVRYMVADKIVELQDAIGVELTKAYLVPAFTVNKNRYINSFIDIFRICWKIVKMKSVLRRRQNWMIFVVTCHKRAEPRQ